MATKLNYIIQASWQGSRDVKAAKDDIGGLKKEAKGATSGTMELSGGLGNLKSAAMGIVAGGAILAIGSQMAKVGWESIQAASDVEESTSKFNTVFGASAAETEEALSQIADTINRSKYDLIEYAGNLGALLVPMGFTQEAAAALSVDLSVLAEDIASFNNVSTEEALGAIRSGLTGETEPLKRFGVILNQARIEQEALTSGIWDGVDALTAQEKAQATVNLIMQDTTTLQGDAERTSGSFANQMKGLEAATQELKIAIGEQLLPTAVDFVATLTDGVGVLIQFVEWSEKLGEVAAGGGTSPIPAPTSAGASAAQYIKDYFAELEHGTTVLERARDLGVLTREEFDKLNNEILTGGWQTEDEKRRVAELEQELEDLAQVTEIQMVGAQEELNDKLTQTAIIREKAARSAAFESREAIRGAHRFKDALEEQKQGYQELAEEAYRTKQAQELLFAIDEYEAAAAAIQAYADAREQMAFTGQAFRWALEQDAKTFDPQAFIFEQAPDDLGADFLAQYGVDIGIISENAAGAAINMGKFYEAVAAANERFQEGDGNRAQWVYDMQQAQKILEGIDLPEGSGTSGEDELGQQAAYWDAIDQAADDYNTTIETLKTPLQQAIEQVDTLSTDIETLTQQVFGVEIEVDPDGDASGAIEEIRTMLDDIPTYIDVVVNVTQTGSTDIDEEPPAPGSAIGAHFIVPGGYPNDTYPMRVSSGEEVIVRTPGQRRNQGGAGVSVTNYFYGPVGIDEIEAVQERASRAAFVEVGL